RFDASGTRLAGAVERQGGKLGIWRIGEGRDYRTFVHSAPLKQLGYSSVAVHPDGQLLAAAIYKLGVGLWDLSSGRQLDFLPVPDTKNIHVPFDRTGALYTKSWAGTHRWPVHVAGNSTSSLSVGPPQTLPFGRGQSNVAVSPDGRILAKG